MKNNGGMMDRTTIIIEQCIGGAVRRCSVTYNCCDTHIDEIADSLADLLRGVGYSIESIEIE